MTIVQDRRVEVAERRDQVVPATAPPARRPATLTTVVGASMCWLALLILGFGVFVFGISAVQHDRSQANLYKSFRKQLGEATAPTGPTTPGSPVAVLDIPAIGLHHEVVVEGTSAGMLTHGPGHRVNSPLPGEAGVAAIYGKRTSFGAPFGHLTRLRFGDLITVTTGFGPSVYSVTQAGDSSHPIDDPAPNRLLLITADSQLHPHHTVTISAQLKGAPVPAGDSYPALPAADRALATDPGAVLPLMMWSMALLVTVSSWTLARTRWARRPAYLVGLPVLVAVLWNVYENGAQLLPNLL